MYCLSTLSDHTFYLESFKVHDTLTKTSLRHKSDILKGTVAPLIVREDY